MDQELTDATEGFLAEGDAVEAEVAAMGNDELRAEYTTLREALQGKDPDLAELAEEIAQDAEVLPSRLSSVMITAGADAVQDLSRFAVLAKEFRKRNLDE